MRITKIALKNFRAYYGEHIVDLGKKGRNLLVYGENGSGKSSLLKAIELFIDSHVRDLKFSDYKNFFVQDSDDGYVKISVREDKDSPEMTHEWSQAVRETNTPHIIDASKSRGSLDYKALLEIYFLHPKNDRIDLFNILIKNILKNSINFFTGNFLSDDWVTIQDSIPTHKNHTRKIEAFEELLSNFNNGLSSLLKELEEETSAILQEFGYPLKIALKFEGVKLDIESKCCTGNSIFLDIRFFDTSCPLPHQFLNEAKLSAIALSIYLAALLVNPSSNLEVLVLDDVLIGLDMSNRLPIIEIIKNKFPQHQIFFMTYDREWYDTKSDWHGPEI